jgi:hypothetical protein
MNINNKSPKGLGAVAEHLPSKNKNVGSIPNTGEKKNHTNSHKIHMFNISLNTIECDNVAM